MPIDIEDVSGVVPQRRDTAFGAVGARTESTLVLRPAPCRAKAVRPSLSARLIFAAALWILLGSGCSQDGGSSDTARADQGRGSENELHASVPPSVEERLGFVVAELRTALAATLKSALAEGPVAAIDACRVEAPRLAQEFSNTEIRVGRTSHRLRNPANAPAPWMRAFLAEFQALEAAPNQSRTVSLGNRETGYVEAIYTQPLCLTCHGEQVAPSLLEKIRAVYPEDEATGFKVGELRGLFWATATEID